MAGEYALEGWAVPEGLEALHALVERAAAELPEVSREDLSMLETAVIEIAGNVVEHGRPPGEVSWSFTLRVDDELLRGVLTDDGHLYAGDLTAAMPGEDEETGRGLALAGLVLDELAYDRVDGVNVWTMVRRRR